MTKGTWSGRSIVYLVEGETEVKLLEVLKLELRCIYPGKVRMRNVVQERLRQSEFIQYGNSVNIVFLFDTDTANADILKANLECVKELPNCHELICIPQVKNLEDELKYACGLKDIRELTCSRSIGDFKRDFLRMKNIGQILLRAGFDIQRIWSRNATGAFAVVKNEAEKIKKK